MKKKYVFSSANLCFLLFWLAFCNEYFAFFFFAKRGFESVSVIGALLSSIFFIGKYRLFLDECKSSKNCENEYVCQRNTSITENFIICALNGGFSKCISMFSGFKLTVFKNNNKIQHSIDPVDCGRKYKVAESFISLIFSVVGFLLSKFVCNFDFRYGVVVFLTALVIGNKNQVLKKIFSVKYSKIGNYSINVMLPLGNFLDVVTSKIGLAGISENTIYIDVNLLNNNELVVKYVIEHEKAHILNLKQHYKLYRLVDNIFSFLAIVSPFVLYSTVKGNIYWVPAIIYACYVILTSRKYKKIEFEADLVASEHIGVDNCINALSLLKEDMNTCHSSFFHPSIDERIEILRSI